MLDQRSTHPWNILTILHRTGFGLGESKEWMRQSGRWPEFIDVLDRTNLAFMQALASDEDAETLVDQEGNISFEYDLRDMDGRISQSRSPQRRVVDPDAPPASKWWWMAAPIVVPVMLVFLLFRLALLLIEDIYIRITGRK